MRYRMFCSALPYARELDLNLPLVTYQGALVKEAVSGEVLLHRPVPLDLAREAVAWVKKLGYHINVYHEDKLYENHKVYLKRKKILIDWINEHSKC